MKYLKTGRGSDNRYFEQAQLPDDICKALKRALGRTPPDELYFSIAWAMQSYMDRADPEDFKQKWDAVRRVAQSARELQRQIRRAEAAFGISPTPRRTTA